MALKLSLWPLLGFINSRPRQDVPLNAMTGESRNWLVGRGRLRRRPGSAITSDTLAAGVEVAGLLESKWGAKARRMISAALPSLLDGLPTWLILYTNETTKAAQLAFLDTNGGLPVLVVGKEFDDTFYPQPTLLGTQATPLFRVVPHVYENENGGLTLARLSYPKARRYLCGGSRDLLQQDSDLCWPGLTSAPGKWNGRFNVLTEGGTDSVEVYPLGMIPPLQMPTVVAGNDLGAVAGTTGPFKGSDAFFYTLLFVNERGEKSRYPIPRPPDSAWAGYAGFGYCHVDAANPTHFFDSVVFNFLACGPPGTVAREIARSTKVNITSSTDVTFPAAGELFICARIDNNTQTSFTLREGNDLALDTSPIMQELLKVKWPDCGRVMGRFDGHAVIGSLKPNKYALLVAPWANGAVNAPVDDAALYGLTQYYVCVTPTNVVLRVVLAGNVTDRSVPIAGKSLLDMVDYLSTNQTIATVTKVGQYAKTPAGFIGLSDHEIYVPLGVAGVPVGSVISAASTDFSPGTKVTGYRGTTVFLISKPPLVNRYSGTSVDFIVLSTSATDPAPWGAGVVPGADAEEQCENLLRTRVATTATWANASKVVTLIAAQLSNAPYISPGMRVYAAEYPVGTEVVSVVAATGVVTVDTNSTGANSGGAGGEAITFAYDTGDSTRAFATTLAATGAPTTTGTTAQMTPVTANNAAGTNDSNDATIFTATYTAAATPTADSASEGYSLGACPNATILSVRIVIRAKKVDAVNHPVVTISPCLNGVAIASVTGQVLSDATWTEYVFDVLLNPATGNRFTHTEVDAYKWGARMDVVGGAAGDKTVVSIAKVKVDVVTAYTALDPGWVRSFGNALPVALPWRKSYLDRFPERRQSLAMSVASPGRAQNAINTWRVGNEHTGPGNFGPLLGVADMGPALIVFFAKGRMRLWNPRTGLTHADEDYTLSTVSWVHGARSPYAICAGNLWAIALSSEGFYVCGLDAGESLISKNVYDSTAPEGQRGELEYAIAACIAASESNSDAFAIHASVENEVLKVRYWSSEAAGHPDRELRYDFSASVGRVGPAAVLQEDGTPYPWSPPQTLRVSCSTLLAKADGHHVYGAIDSNGGTADGRVDELDTGTEDNGVAILPVVYSGLYIPKDMQKVQPERIYALCRKAGTGVSIALARDPEKALADTQWEENDMPTSGANDLGRAVSILKGQSAMPRAAIAAKVFDDGTGPCPEISQVLIDAEDRPSVSTKQGGG